MDLSLPVAFALGSVSAVAATRRRDRRAPLRPTAEQSREHAADVRFDVLLGALEVAVLEVDGRGMLVQANAAARTLFRFGDRPYAHRALIELVTSVDLDRRVRDALEGHASRGALAFVEGADARTLACAVLPLAGGALVTASETHDPDELERARREFLSTVSHELRTPLASVTLMIETILADPADEEAQRRFLPEIKREIDRMVVLVRDLLELARAESGRLAVDRTRIDLAEVAAANLRPFAARAQQAGIELAFAGTPTYVDADGGRIAQIVVNLVDNALRHTAAGGHVHVAVGQAAGVAQLVVTDDGAGIPWNDLPHVFERFYVVDRSRARIAGGTGLGLAIVKHLAELHGGHVTATSELGAGATFTCRFPGAASSERTEPSITL